MGSSEWVEPRLLTREDWRQWRGQVRRSQVIKVPYGLLERVWTWSYRQRSTNIFCNEPERKHHGALWSLTAAPLCDRRRKPPWPTHEWRDVAVLHESVICEFHIIFRLHERVFFWFFSHHLKLWKPFLSCGLSTNRWWPQFAQPCCSKCTGVQGDKSADQIQNKRGCFPSGLWKYWPSSNYSC